MFCVTGGLPRCNSCQYAQTSLTALAFRGPGMSAALSRTPGMHQTPPPESPLPRHRRPAEPGCPLEPELAPTLPARPVEPGRRGPLPDLVPLPDLAAAQDLATTLRRLDVPESAPPLDGEDPDIGPPSPHTAGHQPAPAAEESLAPAGSAGHDGWPSQFAQVLAETLAGSRPAQQLRPWTTEQTRQQIRQLAPLLATGQQPRVRRVMSSAPSEGVLELTAVVGFGPRVRVLAVRLERVAGSPPRWQCTALESA
jgi:Family of unknown function (DUF6459)